MSSNHDGQTDDRDATNYVAAPAASTDTDGTRYSDAPADPHATAYTPSSGATDNAAPRLPRRFGNYELLAELGHGGMGVVYKAREFTPERLVALKVIRSAELATDEDVRLFRQEANEAARLDHPHITPVYEVGEHDGLQFFTMKLVEGGSLSQHLERYQNDPKGAAKLTATAARAVHYAHQRQLLHRDLKPGNILLDASGQPHVADFGLAKRMGGAGEASQSQGVGTPEYMAPEQARGDARLTTAADVYALGGVLYALLAGRPPFRGDSPWATIEKVLTEEPTPPSKLRPGVPRDLETICLKCLQKEPARRYGSAEALAEDLERWLRGEPVRSRPVGRMERVWLWSRRNPRVAGLSAALVALLIVAAAGASAAAWYFRDLSDQKGRALHDKETALGNEQIAEKNEKEKGWKAQDLAVRGFTRQGERALAGGNPLGALLWYAEALKGDRDENRADEDSDYRTREEMHRIRIGTLLSQTPRVAQAWYHAKSVNHAAFSADGRYVVTSCEDFTARVWDATTGQAVTPPLAHDDPVRFAAFSRNGRFIVTACGDPSGRRGQGEARVWEVATGKCVAGPLRHPGLPKTSDMVRAATGDPAPDYIITKVGIITHAAFRPDGRVVATASDEGTARLWDAVTGAPVGKPMPHGRPVQTVEFSPDGKWLATAGDMARVWDAATGEPVTPPLKAENASIRKATFSPDGQRLATVGYDKTAQLWDLTTAKPTAKPLALESYGNDVQFSPDGRRLAVVEESIVDILELASGKEVKVVHTGARTAAFSPDGRRLITAGGDVRIWDVQTGRPLAPPLSHGAGVAAFNADGRHVVTVEGDAAWVWELPVDQAFSPKGETFALSQDGALIAAAWGGSDEGKYAAAQVWDTATGEPITGPLEHAGRIAALAFSADGGRVATASDDGTARVWDARTGVAVVGPLKHGAKVSRVVFSPDGQLLATVDAENRIRLWDMASGAARSAPAPLNRPVQALCFSPDGRRLGLGLGDVGQGEAQIWDAESGQPVCPPLAHKGEVTTVAFNADGKRLLTTSQFGVGVTTSEARLWNVRTGAAASQILPRGALESPVLSQDGRLLFTGSRLREAATGEPVSSFPTLYANCAAFSPDGLRLVAGTSVRIAGMSVGEARMWNVKGQPLLAPIRLPEAPTHVAFSPNGRLLVTVCFALQRRESEAQVWDAATGDAVSFSTMLRGEVEIVCFAPDSRSVVLCSRETGEVCLWVQRLNLARDDRPFDDLQGEVNVLTGRRVDDTGGDAPYSAADGWETYQKRNPREGPGSASAAALWFHRAEARRGEAEREWSAVVWHLDRLIAARPHDAALFARRGRAHEEQSQWGKADQDYSQAVAQGATDPAVWYGRGKARAALTKWAEAIDDYSGALERGTGDWRIFFARGAAYAEQGKFDEAAEDMERGAKPLADQVLIEEVTDEVRRHERAGNWAAVLSLIDCLLRRNSPQLGVLRGDLSSQDAYAYRGTAYLALGEDAKGRQALQRAVELGANHDAVYQRALTAVAGQLKREPKSSRVWFSQGCVHWELGQWDQSETAFGEVAALDPKCWAAWIYRGAARMNKGESENALADFTKAVELAPKDQRGWALRGEARANLKQYKEAVADYAQAVELAPDDPLWRQSVALARLADGDAKGYQEACVRFLERAGDTKDAEVATQIIRTCTVDPGAGVDFARLVRLGEDAVKSDGKNADYRAALGAALFRSGKNDAAVQNLEQARQLAGKEVSAPTCLFLAMALRRAGKAQDAARIQEDATRRVHELMKAESGAAWYDRVEGEVLLREAEAPKAPEP